MPKRNKQSISHDPYRTPTGRLKFEWYVVKTEPQREKQAQRELENQGFRTWLPMARTYRRSKNGLLQAFRRPLFGSYLFVSFDWQKQRWQAIASTRGVKRFLGYAEGQRRPDPIPKGVIPELQEYIREQGGVLDISNGLSRPPKKMAIDQMVQILYGPLRDLEAKVVADTGARTVEILLIAAGALGAASIKLDRDILAVAK